VRRGVGERIEDKSKDESLLVVLRLVFLAAARLKVPGRETHEECESGKHDRRLFQSNPER
jgi:hypothetical protein